MVDNRRYGKFYSRRRRHVLQLSPEIRITRNDPPTDIDQSNIPLLDTGGINWMQGRRSHRQRRATFLPITDNSNYTVNPPFHSNNLIDVPIQADLHPSINVVTFDSSGLINVPIQLQPQLDRFASLPVYEVPVQVTTLLGKRSHEDILHAPLGTFNAPASTSSSAKKPRTSRSRRQNFDPIILPRTIQLTSRSRRRQTIDERRAANRVHQRNYRRNQTPSQRATLQALNTVRKRAFRARRRAAHQVHYNAPLLSIAQRNAIRQRNWRASRTIRQKLVIRAAKNLQRRNARLTRRAQLRFSISSNRHEEPSNSQGQPSNAQLFRQSIQAIEWGWCDECNTRFPDMSSRGLCEFCKKDKEKHPEGSLFSAANMMDPGPVPLELSRLTELESLLIASNRFHGGCRRSPVPAERRFAQ